MTSTTAPIQKTPLYNEHLKLSAKMVEFAGWNMPIQYKGLREEHDCVRNHVGLFDVSHMGEIRFKGPKAVESLEWLTTNSVAKLQKGQAHYNLLPNDQGGLVDDIFIYCLEPNADYLVCVNASNIEKDFAWMQAHNKGADITNESNQWGQIAVQGPKALLLGEKTLKTKLVGISRNQIWGASFQGTNILIATTGYTGEIGFEVFVPADKTADLWNAFLNDGAEFQVQPIGLGARDTLRTEVKYSLYGHEIDDTSNPYEAGLGWVIKPAAKDFVSKAQIVSKKETPTRKLVGVKTIDKGIPRQGYNLVDDSGQTIGQITTGTHSPTLDAPIGIAYVQTKYAELGTEVFIDIRGRKVKAQVCATPFVKTTLS